MQREGMVWGLPLPLKRYACTEVRYVPGTYGLRASKLLSSCRSHTTQHLTDMSSRSLSIAQRYKALGSVVGTTTGIRFRLPILGANCPRVSCPRVSPEFRVSVIDDDPLARAAANWRSIYRIVMAYHPIEPLKYSSRISMCEYYITICIDDNIVTCYHTCGTANVRLQKRNSPAKSSGKFQLRFYPPPG